MDNSYVLLLLSGSWKGHPCFGCFSAAGKIGPNSTAEVLSKCSFVCLHVLTRIGGVDVDQCTKLSWFNLFQHINLLRKGALQLGARLPLFIVKLINGREQLWGYADISIDKNAHCTDN